MSSGGGGGAVTPGSGPGGLNNQEVNGLMQTIDQQKKNIEEYENKSKLMQKEIEDLKSAAKDLVPAVNVCTSQKRTLEPFLEPLSHHSTPCINTFLIFHFLPCTTQWEESFSKHLWFAIVIVFWLKWAGYLAVAGLNLLAQISDRISPCGV